MTTEEQQIIAAALDELDGYLYEVRNDWSDFDGRSNRRIVQGIVAPLRELSKPEPGSVSPTTTSET